ncbi:MAG: hypothetical protein ABI972_31440 [Acidobacteriota bacterium]
MIKVHLPDHAVTHFGYQLSRAWSLRNYMDRLIPLRDETFTLLPDDYTKFAVKNPAAPLDLSPHRCDAFWHEHHTYTAKFLRQHLLDHPGAITLAEANANSFGRFLTAKFEVPDCVAVGSRERVCHSLWWVEDDAGPDETRIAHMLMCAVPWDASVIVSTRANVIPRDKPIHLMDQSEFEQILDSLSYLLVRAFDGGGGPVNSFV